MKISTHTYTSLLSPKKYGQNFSFTAETPEEANILKQMERLIEGNVVSVSRKAFCFSDDNHIAIELDYKKSKQ